VYSRTPGVPSEHSDGLPRKTGFVSLLRLLFSNDIIPNSITSLLTVPEIEAALGGRLATTR
jgi:hypothetical protein